MNDSPNPFHDDYLVFGSPLIEDDEINEVVDSLRKGWIGAGPKVARFEQEFAAYKGTEQAAAVNSCTAGLHLSLLAAGLKPGDEVITTPLTFCATINSIIHSGATPVLADIDPRTMNIDPAEIEKKITRKTKALLPVHFAGRSCEMDSIIQLADRYDLKIIEDCAHAIETEYHGRRAGTIGDFGCFSFYVTKNMTTGEGGMVVAKQKQDIDRVKTLALHGLSADAWKRFSDEGFKHYYVVDVGYKYNMMDIQAALGIHQLQRIESRWKRRQEIWQAYNNTFRDLPITLPAPPENNTRHAYHLYTLLIDEKSAGISRDEFASQLHQLNIGTGIHYLSMTEHPCYQERFGWTNADCPHAFQTGRQTVSLPLSPKLSDLDVERVIAAVRSAIY
ncbi:MAG: DegT/DnrJ/EryC1/StrS family aminotransferase [Candidatus Hinthialibacter antarcticus]|nr:DegT/DnrJ/EryC1/StrS family aminotransferase [Candidatus Hinthialibacter antarcticus]